MSNETNRISNEILSISDAGPRDVSKLAPVKFWGEPEPPIEVTLDGVDGEKRFFRFQAGSAGYSLALAQPLRHRQARANWGPAGQG